MVFISHISPRRRDHAVQILRSCARLTHSLGLWGKQSRALPTPRRSCVWLLPFPLSTLRKRALGSVYLLETLLLLCRVLTTEKKYRVGTSFFPSVVRRGRMICRCLTTRKECMKGETNLLFVMEFVAIYKPLLWVGGFCFVLFGLFNFYGLV